MYINIYIYNVYDAQTVGHDGKAGWTRLAGLAELGWLIQLNRYLKWAGTNDSTHTDTRTPNRRCGFKGAMTLRKFVIVK